MSSNRPEDEERFKHREAALSYSYRGFGLSALIADLTNIWKVPKCAR